MSNERLKEFRDPDQEKESRKKKEKEEETKTDEAKKNVPGLNAGDVEPKKQALPEEQLPKLGDISINPHIKILEKQITQLHAAIEAVKKGLRISSPRDHKSDGYNEAAFKLGLLSTLQLEAGFENLSECHLSDGGDKYVDLLLLNRNEKLMIVIELKYKRSCYMDSRIKDYEARARDAMDMFKGTPKWDDIKEIRWRKPQEGTPSKSSTPRGGGSGDKATYESLEDIREDAEVQVKNYARILTKGRKDFIIVPITILGVSTTAYTHFYRELKCHICPEPIFICCPTCEKSLCFTHKETCCKRN